MIENNNNNLYNEDLAPIPREKRTWGTWNYAALWISMSLCIPTYMLASSLIGSGMNWWQAILTIFLGNTIVLIPMILNGHAGAKYGIPFPVFARASFGTRGANIPAMLRAIVACGWFGIQTWIGGAAIYNIVRASNTDDLFLIILVAEHVYCLSRGRKHKETLSIQGDLSPYCCISIIILGHQ